MLNRPLFLFGSLLDSLECEPYITRKRDDIASRLAGMAAESKNRDPYDALSGPIRKTFGSCVEFAGKVPIDDWLRPIPNADPMNLMMVSLTSYRTFNDSGGPEDYARLVYEALRDPSKMECDNSHGSNRILERTDDVIPIMFGVDHSASGGAIQAISEYYGPEDLILVVLDYHADIRPTHISLGLSQWDSERRGIPWYDTPRPDRYGAGSFLYYLFEHRVVLPENTVILGPVAYPTRRLRQVDDSRVQAYVSLYDSLIEKGLTIINRHEFKMPTWKQRMKSVLDKNNCSKLYISLDTDVGVLGPLNATRLLHFGRPEIPMRGLTQDLIFQIAKILHDHVLDQQISIAGMDFMEIDSFLIDRTITPQITDMTTSVIINFVNRLL